MPRTHVIWIQSNALPPLPSGGTSLAFASDLILPFADLSAAQGCTQEIVAVLKRHNFTARILTAESDPGGTPASRGHIIWIQANALPPLPPGGATLQFAKDLVLPFADPSAARSCAQDIVNTLERHGLKTEIRNN